MNFILRTLFSVCLGLCLLGLELVYAVSGAIIRNLPTLSALTKRAAREILFLSYRAYRPIVEYIKSYLGRYMDVENAYVRSTITTLLSLLFLILLCLMMGWAVSTFGLGLAIIHGIAVGIVWNDTGGQPDGLNLGEEVL